VRWLAITSILCGCDPFAFDEYEDQAGVVVYETPDGYRGAAFGSVIVGYEGTLNGQLVSRFAVSGGRNTAIRVLPVWSAGALSLGPATKELCESVDDCNESAGRSILGFGRFDGKEMCVVSPVANGDNDQECEGGEAPNVVPPTPPDAEFGTRAVAIADDLALATGAGGIYRVRPGRSELLTGVTGDVNTRIAATLFGPAALAVATVSGDNQVLRFVVPIDGALAVTTCPADPSTELGDVVIGHLEPTTTVVAWTSGTGVSVELLSDTSDPCASSGHTVVCTDRRGVACAGSGFGAALAMGDLDGDGSDELLVGAPMATVGESAGAGAVFVFRLDGDAFVLVDVLTDSDPEEGAGLGKALATVGTNLDAATLRDEVVAGAPGIGAVFLFLCSALANDTPAAGSRCIP